jgi:hypothetical protein
MLNTGDKTERGEDYGSDFILTPRTILGKNP